MFKTPWHLDLNNSQENAIKLLLISEDIKFSGLSRISWVDMQMKIVTDFSPWMKEKTLTVIAAVVVDHGLFNMDNKVDIILVLSL